MVGDPTKTELKEFLECGWDEVEKQQKLLASFCASADSKLGGRHDARTKMLHERLWAHFASGQCSFRVPHNVYLKLFQLSPSLRDQAFQSYDIVVLDEAQDCTDCMLEILKSKRICVWKTWSWQNQYYTYMIINEQRVFWIRMHLIVVWVLLWSNRITVFYTRSRLQAKSC